MPIIYISNKDRLISSARTWEWQLLKIRKDRKTKALTEEWVFFRNYTSLESALNDVANVCIRTSSHEDILDAISDIKVMLASLCNSLTPKIEPAIARRSFQERLNDG